MTRENLVEIAELLHPMIPGGTRVLGDDIVYDIISVAATVGEFVIMSGGEWVDTVTATDLAKRYSKIDAA
ncbi:hypothetical protein [Aeromicrobium sp. 179-A 4D2 NHS]|uniref:hypothetical protein n=1 Tax=Aeromicrobium sp. 179-A 4D2 NHS TaxID=3142375 RepID=UPI0039A2C65D